MGNGGTYYGELKDDQRYKRGAMVYSEGFYKGATLEAEFLDNLVHGHGILTIAEGDVFEGDYLNGFKNGYGY